MHFLSTGHKHEENLPPEGHGPCRLPYRLFITARRGHAHFQPSLWTISS